ncbi:MAG: PilZ domain-containing protein [Planctomycetota bacterium]
MTERFSGGNRRQRGRILAVDARTSLGEILNISGGGLRLRTKKRKLAAEGLSYSVPLKLPFGEKIALRGQTVWAKRIDRGLYEIGVQWADPDREADQISKLVELTSSSHNVGSYNTASDDAA